MQNSWIKRHCAFALCMIMAFAVSSAIAQPAATTPATAPTETSQVQTHPPVTGPISHNYKLPKIDGTLNITINSDGTWDFSGTGKAFLHKDYDVSLALRNKQGEMVIFQYIGDASHGIQFSKQGQTTVLKDNFASFAKGHSSSWSYRFSEDKEGRALAYEARMKKLEALRKEEEEAIKKHDEKVAAEKRAARKREEQQQIAAEQAQQRAQQQQQQSSGGGGSSVGSVLKTVGTVAGVVGTILSFL
jgi:hypothetical protein